MQLWSQLAELEGDDEPGAHACRLQLWVATRCCAALNYPWSPQEQLQACHAPRASRLARAVPRVALACGRWHIRLPANLTPVRSQAYLAKMHHLPPSCHLAPGDELQLLRRFAPPSAAAATRRSFLEASLAPAASPRAPLRPAYPSPARKCVDLDTAIDLRGLAGAGAPSTWMRRMVGVGYTRPVKDEQARARVHVHVLCVHVHVHVLCGRVHVHVLCARVHVHVCMCASLPTPQE